MGNVEPGGPSDQLQNLRAEIDTVDQELIDLLNRRIGLAKEIGRLKDRSTQPYFVPERERQIHEKLQNAATELLGADRLSSIFREIISAAVAAEKPLQIAYWGPQGTFTHQAALKSFGRSAEYAQAYNIREVFHMVERGQADYGVVPIENSIGGVVPETLDMFPVTDVKIVSETFLEIHHNLGTVAKDIKDIKRIYAGPQPASQCRMWIRDHLPEAQIVDVVPTAAAAQKALQDPESAALANEVCLEIYGLPSLANNIEDFGHNRTRFIVIGKNDPAPSGNDKTSLMFKVRNRRGELYHILGCFVEHEVNLTMIESRPDPRSSFQYVFYVDCDGHRLEQNVTRAINDMRSVAIETVILGSYPSYDQSLHSL